MKPYLLSHAWYAGASAGGAAVNKTWALPFDAVLVRLEHHLAVHANTDAAAYGPERVQMLVSLGGAAGLADKLEVDAEGILDAGNFWVQGDDTPLLVTAPIVLAKSIQCNVLVNRGVQIRGTYVPTSHGGINAYAVFWYQFAP